MGVAVLLAGWWVTHPSSLVDGGAVIGMGADGPDPAFFGAADILTARVTILEVATHVAGSAEFTFVACPPDARFYGAMAADEPLLTGCVPPNDVTVAPSDFTNGTMTVGVIGHATAPEGGALCTVDVRYDNGLQRGWQRGIIVKRAMGPGNYEDWCPATP